MPKTKTKPKTSKPAPPTPAWRSLPISDMELSPDDAILATLNNLKLTTFGEVADAIQKAQAVDEEAPFSALLVDDHNTLVDFINCAAEDDDTFEELLQIDEPDTDLDESDDGPEVEVIDPTTPEWLIRYDDLTRQMITKAEEDAELAESVYEHRHSLASAAKKVFEASVDELRKMIRDRREGRTKKPEPSLFHPKHKAKPDASDAPATDDTLWQQFPLTFDRWGRFGLTAKDIEILNGGETKNFGVNPILVFGDVSKFVTPNPNNPGFSRSLTDFKRFGDAAFERWGKAEEQFWAWWKGGDTCRRAAERVQVSDRKTVLQFIGKKVGAA